MPCRSSRSQTSLSTVTLGCICTSLPLTYISPSSSSSSSIFPYQAPSILTFHYSINTPYTLHLYIYLHFLLHNVWYEYRTISSMVTKQQADESKGALGGLTDTVGKTGKGLTDTVSGVGKTAGDTVGSATKGVSDTTKGEFLFLSSPTLCAYLQLRRRML
jgi:hypothetical protein